ncbi:MAG: hypothetical protein KUA35_16150 [Pseudodesulfovibrio sp.]|uniref:Uncharacterized protein n=1 Tax=Pseudodesulfovibrio aespoeensis (strain ATCC 700646 / DSM 10631 / Aspo-2) TaxID=643562 RepID=E6VWT4_PSEA9|nr:MULTISPECIES: hypothetical protein [Pseudodesulfovibrio]MBU4242841.1 hypothetical protein [Pseudomonadota bacterium]ADU63696.1 hypothetical protein Daes_2700 [Pseudodesulfovibrio aespoeensis Aspo-2]MBU4379288.1 hypothetical protein [Pseudomonadota bacterium]MBU4476350.1 hypothetical protein [Pseudomonadota bacterium]MBU4515438.1 hypothetical protein [Pseudomonadota bacterium]
MPRHACIILCAALLLATLAQKVTAEEQPDESVRVQGLVVSSRNGLVINDGTRDYLLLGVDDIGIEGRVCVIVGTPVQWLGRAAIRVREVISLPDERQPRDPIGTGPLAPAPCARQGVPFNLSTAPAA